MGTKKIIYFLVIIIILFSLDLYSQFREMTLEEKVNKSDLIVIGEVLCIDVKWEDGRSSIGTYVTVSIEECINGSNNLENITIKMPGGFIEEEGIGLAFTGWTNPAFKEKEKVFLFLRSISDEEYYAVVNSAYGKYMIFDDNKVLHTNYFKEEFVDKIKAIMALEEKK